MTMIGAARPMVAAVGIRPTPAVAMPISVTVTRKVYLRPSLSPRKPNRIAPSGRNPKPTAKAGPDQQHLQRLVVAGEERRADQAGERAVDEEIVPFEDRAGRTGGDDEADFLRARLVIGAARCRCAMCYSPSPSHRRFGLAGRSSAGKGIARGLPRQHASRRAGRDSRAPVRSRQGRASRAGRRRRPASRQSRRAALRSRPTSTRWHARAKIAAAACPTAQARTRMPMPVDRPMRHRASRSEIERAAAAARPGLAAQRQVRRGGNSASSTARPEQFGRVEPFCALIRSPSSDRRLRAAVRVAPAIICTIASRAGIDERVGARFRDPGRPPLRAPDRVIAEHQQRKGDDDDDHALDRAEAEAEHAVDRPEHRIARGLADIAGDQLHRGIGDQQQQGEGEDRRADRRADDSRRALRSGRYAGSGSRKSREPRRAARALPARSRAGTRRSRPTPTISSTMISKPVIGGLTYADAHHPVNELRQAGQIRRSASLRHRRRHPPAR